MGTIAVIASVVLSISFLVFVAFFGRLPALRRTPIAWLHRAIWVHIPGGLLALDRKLTSGRFTSSMQRFGHFMMNDKHPTVLIFFFLLLSVSQYISLPSAWPLLSLLQKTTLSVAIVLPYLFLYLSAYSDPGIVTPANVDHHLSQYPYDFALFYPGVTCRTCQTLKPARSKHCPICKACIGRLDHHCIFINNCVGAGNQHWFILLLASTGLLTLYGGSLGARLVADHIRTRNPAWTLFPWSTSLSMHDWLLLWSFGLSTRVGIGSVSMLALLTSPLIWGLLGYNLWNVWGGVTTNESLKWGDWQCEMDDGYAFKRRLGTSRRLRDARFEPRWSRWPAEADQVLVRTLDGRPPPADDPNLLGEGEWERVWKLRDVENLYDLGLWDNLTDLFVPGYRFNDEEVPTAEMRGRKRKRRQKK